jgi:hypothetical protein
MMTTTLSNPPPAALGQGTANTTPGSQVTVTVAPEPMAYLRLDTGEVVGVPAIDHAALLNEFDQWNRLVYEQLLSNEVLALCDDRLLAIAHATAASPNAVSPAIMADAQACQALALHWRQEATEKLREEMKPLDKIGGTGKKLIELMPLKEKDGDKRSKTEPVKDNKEWKREGLDLKRPWGFKSGLKFKTHFKDEERYRGLGPLRVVSSDKLKSSWPKFKDAKAMKWAEVHKADANGKRKIDRTKLKSYLGEQVQGLKLKSSDFFKLEVSSTSTLGPEWLDKWNANANVKGEAKLAYADVDFSAAAAAMRFYSGGSLSGELSPLKGNVNLKAEGNFEVAFAEGKAGGHIYLPSKEGVLLCYLDLEQVVALAQGKPMPRERYDLGAIRMALSAELKGVLGVSLAGEVSIGVEMKDLETKDVDGKTKSGKMPRIKGSRHKAQRARAVDVTGKGDEWKTKAGLAAEVNFFAGVKGGLEIKGAVEWRNPHNAKKEFELFASIAPELQGMAGLAGEAKLAVDYVEGVFRITAHAGVCIGLGAEGTITCAVGAKQLASFTYWMYYNLLHAGFRSLEFISKAAFSATKQLGYLLVCEGQLIEKYFMKEIVELERRVTALEQSFAKADECLKLAHKILASGTLVRFSTPESKGMLIYQLTRFSAANWVGDGAGLFDNYLPTQRLAVLLVLRQTQTKSDIENVIQHIGPTGKKADFDVKLSSLKQFFAVEGPHGFDVPGTRTGFQNDFQALMRERGFGSNFIARGDPAATQDALAMRGDFDAWYDEVHASLKDDATRGDVAIANTEFAYALQRDAGRDHPLYASSEGGFYSATA